MHSVLLAFYFIDAAPRLSLIFHNNTVAIYACSACTMLGPSPGFAYVRVHSSHQIWFCVFSSIALSTTEEGQGERKHRECLCPLISNVHHNLARDDYIEFTLLMCPSKIFRHGNKNTLFLLWYIHSYLIMNFKV
jgi:hypothetical protein